MELEQEKFDTLKELADLQSTISLGRAELLKLKDSAEEYMVVREKEAEERILKVLKESRDALQETTNNHDELSSYNSELKAYANDLTSLADGITTLFGDFHTKMDKADADMQANHVLVSDILKNIKAERIHVAEDRKMLDRDRVEIRGGFKLLADRRGLLEKGFDELKKLQDKNI